MVRIHAPPCAGARFGEALCVRIASFHRPRRRVPPPLPLESSARHGRNRQPPKLFSRLRHCRWRKRLTAWEVCIQCHEQKDNVRRFGRRLQASRYRQAVHDRHAERCIDEGESPTARDGALGERACSARQSNVDSLRPSAARVRRTRASWASSSPAGSWSAGSGPASFCGFRGRCLTPCSRRTSRVPGRRGSSWSRPGRP